MRILVSALICKFGPKAYNVTMLYGDADSTMIPVSASEIQENAVTEIALGITRELALSGVQLPANTYLYNSKTAGSMCSTTTVDANSIQSESNQFILATIEKVGYDDLTVFLNKLQDLLPVFNGKFEHCGSFVI